MKPTRQGVLEQARATLGMKEDPPFSNRCEISEWYGLIAPWCAMAVDYWWVKAGGTSLRQMLTSSWAYTPAGLAAGRRAGWAIRHRDAQPGDFVFFDFRRGGDGVEHVGILETNAGDHLVCIEGNTGAGSDADGGAVQRRRREWSQVVGVLRPPYAEAPAPPPPRPAPAPPAVPTIPDEEDEVAVIVDTPDGKSWHCAGTWRKEISRADADALAFLGTKRVAATPQFAALVDRTLQDTHGVSLAAWYAKAAAERR